MWQSVPSWIRSIGSPGGSSRTVATWVASVVAFDPWDLFAAVRVPLPGAKAADPASDSQRVTLRPAAAGMMMTGWSEAEWFGVVTGSSGAEWLEVVTGSSATRGWSEEKALRPRDV